MVLNVAHSLISHLSPFLRQIDYALDWMHVEAGRAVYRCYFFLSASQIHKECLKCIHAERTPLTCVVNSYYSGVAVVVFLRPFILNEIRNSLTFFAVVCIFLN